MLYAHAILFSVFYVIFFFFNDTATTEIYTLSLHDALPIYGDRQPRATLGGRGAHVSEARAGGAGQGSHRHLRRRGRRRRSEEHTSELQSRQYLVCRLLLEKKNKNRIHFETSNINTYPSDVV